MMTILPFYQVDAFAARPFEGNPACVMPLADFLPDRTLQQIAAENNVSETAFLVAAGPGSWRLRWFTPAVEVPLCGHATLAAAHVLYAHQGYAGEAITFATLSAGDLVVRRVEDSRYTMDLPAGPLAPAPVTDDIAAALGARPVEAWAGRFYAARFETEAVIRALRPDIRTLSHLGAAGGGWERGNFGCFSLESDTHDVISRFFAPGSGIDEDPATGSWHAMLGRILAEAFGMPEADCFQAFPRRGAEIRVRYQDGRTMLTGEAVTVIEGRFSI